MNKTAHYSCISSKYACAPIPVVSSTHQIPMSTCSAHAMKISYDCYDSSPSKCFKPSYELPPPKTFRVSFHASIVTQIIYRPSIKRKHVPIFHYTKDELDLFRALYRQNGNQDDDESDVNKYPYFPVTNEKKIQFVPNDITSVHPIPALEDKELPNLFYSSTEIDFLLNEYVASCLISKMNGDSEILEECYTERNHIEINGRNDELCEIEFRTCGSNLFKLNSPKQLGRSILKRSTILKRGKRTSTQLLHAKRDKEHKLRDHQRQRNKTHSKHQRLLISSAQQFNPTRRVPTGCAMVA